MSFLTLELRISYQESLSDLEVTRDSIMDAIGSFVLILNIPRKLSVVSRYLLIYFYKLYAP